MSGNPKVRLTPTPWPSRLRRGGMTLLELVMVIIIIFVIAGAIAPRFSDFMPEMRVRKTTDQVLAMLQKARTDAALYGVRYRVYLSATEGDHKFWIGRETRPLNQPGVFDDLQGSWAPTAYPDDVAISSPDLPTDGQASALYLEFQADGSIGKDASIVVANDKGDTRTLKVEAATGKIYIDAPKQP